MKKVSLFTILICFVISSCSNSKAEEQENKASPPKVVKSTSKKSTTPLAKQDTLTYLPPKEYLAKVITEGAFHEDEVWQGAEKEAWYGLFQGKNNYYIKQTKIITSRVIDPVMDGDDGTRTGWEVKTTNKDTSLILISGLNYLTEKQVESIKFPKEEILPGEKLEFTYKGNSYKLYATGNKQKEAPNSDWYIVSDYKLFFSSVKNGIETKQLLVQHGNFDDEMINIIFAGDIDGDNLLDLIIDKSNHYNAINPTLYLSKPSEKDKLVKEVGEHVSVGC